GVVVAELENLGATAGDADVPADLVGQLGIGVATEDGQLVVEPAHRAPPGVLSQKVLLAGLLSHVRGTGGANGVGGGGGEGGGRGGRLGVALARPGSGGERETVEDRFGGEDAGVGGTLDADDAVERRPAVALLEQLLEAALGIGVLVLGKGARQLAPEE